MRREKRREQGERKEGGCICILKVDLTDESG